MKYLIISIIALIVTYFAFSFAIWDFNASNWGKSTRVGFLLVFCFILWISLCINNFEMEK